MNKAPLLVLIPTGISLLILSSCGPEKRNEFFPVLNYLQSQVKHVDTSVYGIRKIVTEAGHSDTIAIPREQFREEAADFLNIPDLTLGRYTKKYEEKQSFEQDINTAVLAYYPLKKGMEIAREEVTIRPTEAGNDQVKTVYVEWFKQWRDSIVTKKLFWQADQSFKTVTIIEKQNLPDRIIQKEVIWNPKETDSL